MYHIEFDPRASDDLAQLDRTQAQHIFKKIRWLAENAQFIRHKPLHEQFRGMYKLRVGDYRIIYTVNNKQKRIRVHMIGHRDKIYMT